MTRIDISNNRRVWSTAYLHESGSTLHYVTGLALNAAGTKLAVYATSVTAGVHFSMGSPHGDFFIVNC